MRPPLGRRFLTVWFGQTVSLVGSAVSGVGVAVWVYLESGSAAWLGVLAALAALPALLTGPFLPIVDRVSRRRMMLVADTVASVGAIAALTLAVAGRLEVWHLVAAVFVGGIGSAFQFPAFQAAVPLLVERDALGRANGINQFGPALGIVIGPLLATPLVAWWGIEAVLVVDVATFAVALACTTAVRFSDRAPSSSDATSDDDGSWASVFAYLRGAGRPLAVLLAIMAVTNFVLAFFNIAVISLATLLGGAARAGVVLGAGGVAMLVGTLLLGSRGVPRRRIRTLSTALMLAGIGCLAGAVRAEFALLVAGVVIALGAVPAVNAAVSTIYHEWVPPRMHGRVFGLRAAIGHGLESLGAVTAGLLIASVAEPSMAEGGAGAATIGRVIGVGADRGAAAVLAAIGFVLLGIGLWVFRSRINGVLDGTPETDRAMPGATASAVSAV